LFLALLLVLLPDRYEVMRQFDKPAHWRPEMLPIKLYSDDPGFDRVFQHCVGEWNSAGQGQLFRAVSREEADLVVTWKPDRLPRGKAGAVWWNPVMGFLLVEGISVDGTWRVTDGVRARILLQEMGHCLGLDHSENPADVMFTLIVNRRQPLEAARLSGRDRAALAWLYSQKDYVPIMTELPEVDSSAEPTPVPP
jgi:hypothetical protein